MRCPLRAIVCLMGLTCSLAAAAISASAGEGTADEPLRLQTRSRVADPPESGPARPVFSRVEWDAAKTAVVICDMWDKHWCASATARVAEMAPRMNDFVKEARRRGALVIHCPSGTMDFYKETPQRKLALDAPKVETETPLAGWRSIIPEREGELPIDDSDGGCDCNPPCRQHRAWSRQIDTIEIAPGDAIGDGLEVFHLMRQRGVENVVVLGVHTNMCVLGRPFGIRQLVEQGMNVVLARDLTDSMYNPAMRPRVSHFRGTELVVEHIERHWCPTITSDDLLGGAPLRFSGDKRPHAVFLVNEDEYGAHETLPELAQRLTEQHGFHCTVGLGEGHRLRGVEALAGADVAVLYVRRKGLPPEQLDALRRYLAAGGPLVALRTSSHAFSIRGEAPPGVAQWPDFDREILGARYEGHIGNRDGTVVTLAEGQRDHPILAGVEPAEWRSPSWLYLVGPLDEGVAVLATGTGLERTEPVAWTYTAGKSRVFYTSLGHRDDFRDARFRRMLVNAIHWAMDRAAEKSEE